METDWIEGKIKDWILAVESVAELTKYASQSAYAGMQRALQQEWIFVQRRVPNISSFFKKLEVSIKQSFFCQLFGEEIST